ncbi:hypothetical protein M2352_003488 [Azospirillum fermentarium]|uniref:hypothetical protein n=1 Tax=Azospirillum fermentarium TaxID=1233114 RepID=UPI002227A189|nr:hypothetical protein [Azospirillum fermentarium]MCW2247854.1 hypothetical protein [Azospirillum fermentarium]
MFNSFCPDVTPGRIEPYIRAFCKDIRAEYDPVYVKVAPLANAALRDCFNVVKNHCHGYGGEMVFGWNIWLWPNVCLKAEHHAIWRSPEDGLIDLTPKENSAENILFLPDPERVCDVTGEKRTYNICKRLKADPDIEAMLSAERALFDYEEACTVPGTQEMRVNQNEYQVYQVNKAIATAKVALKYCRGPSPCCCGSGEKFAHCHRPDMEELTGRGKRLCPAGRS